MNFDALRRLRFPAARTFGALAALVAGLAALDAAGLPVQAWLRYERAPLAAGELWRGFTAHLVHADARHAALNLAGLALLWLLYAAAASAREWLVVTLASALAVDAGLYVGSPSV
jgi:membrane associated rhomboid family serine protease